MLLSHVILTFFATCLHETRFIRLDLYKLRTPNFEFKVQQKTINYKNS